MTLFYILFYSLTI